MTVQVRPLAQWSDGSIKWLLVDFILESHSKGQSSWELECTSVPAREEREFIHVYEHSHDVCVETGAATFRLGRGEFQSFQQVRVAGAELLDEDRTRVVLRDAFDRRSVPRIDRIVLEERGPVRATLLFEGTFATGTHARFIARLCFFAGTGLARLRFTVHNPNRARHKGGLWDLGDAGSMLFHSLSLRLAPNSIAAERMSWRSEVYHRSLASIAGPLEIYQDSSGGDNWSSENHVNRDGVVPCQFRGYRVRCDGKDHSGLRASPLFGLDGPGGSIAVAVPEFWQQFPKQIGFDDQVVEIGLFPGQWSDFHELQGGEQKTHTVWFHFGRSQACPEANLEWVHAPALARSTPEWYESILFGALDPFTAATSSSETRLQEYFGGGNDRPKSDAESPRTERRVRVEEFR